MTSEMPVDLHTDAGPTAHEGEGEGRQYRVLCRSAAIPSHRRVILACDDSASSVGSYLVAIEDEMASYPDDKATAYGLAGRRFFEWDSVTRRYTAEMRRARPLLHPTRESARVAALAQFRQLCTAYRVPVAVDWEALLSAVQQREAAAQGM